MTDVHALAGAYALDAVTDLERAAFRRHLAGCETCALEVAELRETAARLADGAWSEPPPGLREAVLRQVSHTAQLRPGRADRSGAGPARPWRRWVATAAAAGVLAGGAGVATYVVQEQRVLQERERAAAAQARAVRIDAVLTAPDAVVRQEPAAGAGTVTVVASRQRGEAVVVLAALPSPRADQAYQLWRGTAGGLAPAGVLPAGEGSTTALVSDLADVDLIGVSLEPATGAPTGQPSAGMIVATVPLV